jgi:mRNA-degrading endonuclease RelE of RelBE toxin-antitoxin system
MSAEYRILYADKRVEKQLRSLPQAALRKLDRKLMGLKTDPRGRGVKKLKGIKPPLYELRVWPYRVLFDINDETREVVIYEIIHRRDLERYLRQFMIL